MKFAMDFRPFSDWVIKAGDHYFSDEDGLLYRVLSMDAKAQTVVMEELIFKDVCEFKFSDLFNPVEF